MTMREKLSEKLQTAFDPAILEVLDESHLHVGHAGHRDGGESHFRVRITAAVFEDLSRVDRHRRVNAALAEELQTIHALALEINRT